MTNLTVRGENLFAALGWSQLSTAAARSGWSATFLSRGGDKHWVQTATAKLSGVSPEITAAKENRQAIYGDQPNRKWFQSDPWLAFFALDRGVDFLHLDLFAVIHALSRLLMRRWICR